MLFLIFFLVGTEVSADCNVNDVSPKLSCGLSYTDLSTCTSAGCCWDGENCTMPYVYGYAYDQISQTDSTVSGTLTLNKKTGVFGNADFETLSIEVTQEASVRTYIKIGPTDGDRWVVPNSVLPRPGGSYSGGATGPGGVYTETTVSSTGATTDGSTSYPTLQIVTSRKSGGVYMPSADVIFNLTSSLVFQDQYIQFVMSSKASTVATFGFGESTRTHMELNEESVYTPWNTDWFAAGFDASLYGSHPFLLKVDEVGAASGFMFLNSNAMDLTISTGLDGLQRIAVQATGGIIELYIFGGPTPAQVIQQYQQVVGLPAMVPYWSLGFHNCRWGYPNVQYVKDVVANYSAANIPLETQWMDIDYMDEYKDFTFDPVNFPLSEMQALVSSLHNNDQYFVPIVDPAIFMNDTNYGTYTRGLQQDVYVRDMYGENPFLGQVWPGGTYFPDWFADNSDSWWLGEIRRFYESLAFDGLWIDMNEPANFCNQDGNDQICSLDNSVSCGGGVTYCCLQCQTVDPTNTYDFPPFVPHVSMGSMAGKTVSMNAFHGSGGNNILEYNAHSLYGLMESMSTRGALTSISPEKRPFILTRSTFMGSGRYAAHWQGDNAANWPNLAASIVTMSNMAVFGIPMTGADICGFINDTTVELCTRWIEVGAFSPFSRNHNIRNATPQELYRWESVAAASRTVLNLRYQLLPHLYTLMYLASTLGTTVHNAMWLHFPADANTVMQDGQYMWSDGLLFTPVLTEGSVTVSGYFPTGVWYKLMGDSNAPTVIDTTTSGGKYINLDTPLSTTNVHVRGGSIVPMQSFAMTTSGVRASPFKLLVPISEYGMGTGVLFLDDGVQPNVSSVYSLVRYNMMNSRISSIVESDSYVVSSAFLETVYILGLSLLDMGTGNDCNATLVTENGETILPQSVYRTDTTEYGELTITFSEASSVNVVSAYAVSWSCSEGNGESSHSNGDSSSSGWEAYSTSTKVAVVLCPLFGAVLLFTLAYFHLLIKRRREAALLKETVTKEVSMLDVDNTRA